MTPYYQDEAVTIYHGDCREVLSTLTVDAVVTDPPYGVQLKGKRAHTAHGKAGSSVRPDTYNGFDDSPAYISEVVVPIIGDCRAKAKCVVVTPGIRNLWLYPPADDLGCFYSSSGTGVGRWGFTCALPILFYGSDPYLRSGQGSRPNSSGYHYPNDANEVDHPCAKPIRMVRWLVNRASLPGETVFDPFMGSGTTLRAARDLGCQAIGVELDERYCEIAARRLDQQVLAL